ESCDYYEKDAMQSIFENVEKIKHLNESQSREFPKMSGNLGKDLNKILPWIKKLVPKGLKKQKCCEDLENDLSDLKEHLQDKWEDLKKRISKDIAKENAKIKEKMQEEQASLEGELEDLQNRLDNIQDGSGSNSKTKCCAKFYRKINSLQNDLKNLNIEANENTQEVEEKLKKIQDKLENRAKKAAEVNENLQKREKNIKEMGDKFEKGSKGSVCSEQELEERVHKLEKQVKEHADNIDSATNQFNLTLCQENGEKLAKIEYELEKILQNKNVIRQMGRKAKGGSTTNNTVESPLETHEASIKKLAEILKSSKPCCEKIDDLQALADNLMKSIDLMNNTYDEHIKKSASDLDGIKSLLKDAMDNLADNKQSQTKGEDFQNLLKNLQSEVDKAKDDLKNMQNKLNELPKDKPINSGNHNLNDNLKEQMKKFNENWVKADKRLTLLEERAANKSLDHLKNILEPLEQDIDKLEKEIGQLENTEQHNKASLEKLKNLETQITPCRDSCKDLDQLDDFLDDIEDLELFLKVKLSITTQPTKRVTINRASPEDEGVKVGGVDFQKQITDPT
ncbi:hypothetical protein KR059_003509, partial [Drosophila kikkawai]